MWSLKSAFVGALNLGWAQRLSQVPVSHPLATCRSCCYMGDPVYVLHSASFITATLLPSLRCHAVVRYFSTYSSLRSTS